jgi:hypothetical protein
MVTVWPTLMVPSAHLMVFSKRSQPDGSTRSLSCWTRCGMSSTTTTPVASDGPALVIVFTHRKGVWRLTGSIESTVSIARSA